MKRKRKRGSVKPGSRGEKLQKLRNIFRKPPEGKTLCECNLWPDICQCGRYPEGYMGAKLR